MEGVARCLALAYGLFAACAGGQEEPIAAHHACAITHGSDDVGDPAVVAVSGDGASLCTGTLVAPDTVLTAAHCVATWGDNHVRFGDSLDSATELAGVREVRIHPRFERETFDNDVALLVLAEPVATVPALLPGEPLDPSIEGSPARLVGFGATVAGEAPAVPRKREGWASVGAVGDRNFLLEPDPAQPCLGDSGAPVFATLGGRERLVGVVASGDPGCERFARATRADLVAADLFGRRTVAGSGCSTASEVAGGSGHYVALATSLGLAVLSRSFRKPRFRPEKSS